MWSGGCGLHVLQSVYARQRGMDFLFFGYHIQHCWPSEKIGRKEIILRFFFPRDLARKKKPWGEKVVIESRPGVDFSKFWALDQIWLTVFFFFRTKIPREKKNRKIVRQVGRKEDICDNQKKKPYPFDCG